MRFCDLNLTQDNDYVPWSMNKEELGKPLSVADLDLMNKRFEDSRSMLKRELVRSIEEPINAATSEEQVGVLLDPVFEKLSKGFLMTQNMNPDLLLHKANRNTIRAKLQIWSHQLNNNVPVVKQHPGTKIYRNKFKNVPCVILAAGPSLGSALPILKNLEDKALIMAVDTSYRSCVRRGVTPHFVNAHDAGERGWKFFNGIDSRKTVALFVNYIHGRTIADYAGPIAFYYVDDDSLPVYRTMAYACDGPERRDGSFLESSVIGGSSVAHTAAYIAIQMGCNPITFVGLDLCYPDLTKSHFESDNMKNPSEQPLIDVVGINGHKYKTSASFFSYKVVMERMIPVMEYRNNIQIFTSSENADGSMAGICHSGLRPLPFKEFISSFASKPRSELGQVLEIYKSYGYHI